MKHDYKLTNSEYRLALIIWENEPILSPDLCKISELQLGWKRTTTYTVLKKLSTKGVVRNDSALVTSLVKRDKIQQIESQTVVEQTFENSLPMFIAAFLSNRKLSPEEAKDIRDLIDQHREGDW